jgi:phenylacetic acid degradation operon negative regulatory protein
MGIKRDEVLYTLLWAGDILLHPTFRNLTDSFESWANRNGVLRQLRRLEHRDWIQRSRKVADERAHRLTEAGRIQAMGGRDPEICWNRAWDGLWRLAIFDVPESRNSDRDRLRRYLVRCGFGCLQNSVWITPHPVHELRRLLIGSPVDVGALIFLESRPCTGETDDQIVLGSWDFDSINARYAQYRGVLKRRPPGRLVDDQAMARSLERWLREEREAWLNAVQIDPLLPRCLLPPGYTGRLAWQERRRAIAHVAAN